MQNRRMKGRLLPLLFACACASPATVSAAEEASPPGRYVEVRQLEEDYGYSIWAKNDWFGTAAVAIRFLKRKNLRTEITFPWIPFPKKKGPKSGYFRLPRGEAVQLFRLEQKSPYWAPGLSFRFNSVECDPAAEPDDALFYYPLREDSWLSQGFNAQPTHHGPDAYSVDLVAPAGTPVLAARAGTVSSIARADDPDDPAGKIGGNTINVLHQDGTWAVYGHLLEGSLLVRVGDPVAAGQRIAAVGSTGKSKGPHLHFSLKACTWSPDLSLGYRTVPFHFRAAGPGEPRATTWPARDSALKRRDFAEAEK